jgi:hypothetical protein
MLTGKQRPNLRGFVTWISCFTLLLLLGVSGTASAAVTIDYVLTPNSHLATSVTSSQDFFEGTGGTPTWLDGSLGTPPVSYGGDVPGETLNIMRVEFPDDGSGNIIDGTITITLMDYYHPTDASVPDNANITGINDSTVSGATGSMVGGVVGSWSSDLTGLVHNELSCENVLAGTLCGQFGLPADGTTSIVHNLASTLAIDTLAVPDVASLPMTFNGDYSTVTMEMTISMLIGRQHYAISGSAVAPDAVPLFEPEMQLLMMALMALAGFHALRRGGDSRLRILRK